MRIELDKLALLNRVGLCDLRQSTIDDALHRPTELAYSFACVVARCWHATRMPAMVGLGLPMLSHCAAARMSNFSYRKT